MLHHSQFPCLSAWTSQNTPPGWTDRQIWPKRGIYLQDSQYLQIWGTHKDFLSQTFHESCNNFRVLERFCELLWQVNSVNCFIFYLCIHSFIHPSIHPFSCLSVCLSIYLSIYLISYSVYMSAGQKRSPDQTQKLLTSEPSLQPQFLTFSRSLLVCSSLYFPFCVWHVQLGPGDKGASMVRGRRLLVIQW